MARLRQGAKSIREHKVQHLLRRYEFGLSESEIAQELDWQRRTANNYLRELAQREIVYKEGRLWFVDDRVTEICKN